jgi:SET domain-containing protein
MTTSNVTISTSAIHGKGLFAARDFAAGEKILSWAECAEILSEQAARDLPPYEQKFLSYIDGQNVLFKTPARFINHSCDPNLIGKDGFDIAIRAIKKGEELNADYVLEQVPGLDLACNCDAKKCRLHLSVLPRSNDL